MQLFSNFVIFFIKHNMLCLQAQKTLFLTQKTQYVVSSKNLQSISSAVIMCLHSKKHSAQRNVQRTAQYKAHSILYKYAQIYCVYFSCSNACILVLYAVQYTHTASVNTTVCVLCKFNIIVKKEL